MLYRLFRAKFRNFLPTLQLGLCFIPTFAALLYQYQGVFVSDGKEEAGIGFGVGTVWSNSCENIPLAVGLAMAFPILVLIFHFKELKKDGW